MSVPPPYAQINPGLTESPFPGYAANGATLIKANVVTWTGDGNASKVVTDPANPGKQPLYVAVKDVTSIGTDSMTWFNLGSGGDAINGVGSLVTAVFGSGSMDVGTAKTNQNVLNNSYSALFVYGV